MDQPKLNISLEEQGHFERARFSFILIGNNLLHESGELNIYEVKRD